MEQLASLYEYMLFKGGASQVPDETAADQALVLATGVVQAYLGQNVIYVADEVATVYPKGPGVVLLPELPVTAVTSVVVDAETLTVTDDYTLRAGGVLRLASGTLEPATVTYSHGYVTIPTTIKLVTMQIAAHLMASTGDGRPVARESESIGTYSYSVAYAEAAAAGALAPSHTGLLAPYRVPYLV